MSSSRAEESVKLDPGTPSENFSQTFDRKSGTLLKEVFRDSEVLERKLSEEGDVDDQVFNLENKFLVR